MLPTGEAVRDLLSRRRPAALWMHRLSLFVDIHMTVSKTIGHALATEVVFRDARIGIEHDLYIRRLVRIR
jgi:hypothetical protein